MRYSTSKVLIRFLPFVAITILVILIQNSYVEKITAQSKLMKQRQEELITLVGNVDKSAIAEHFRGKAKASERLEEVKLVLSIRNREQLEQLLIEQQDINSSLYHKWLTPEKFAARFGATDEQISNITQWLSSNGLIINSVERGRTIVSFSGTVEQLEKTFHTRLNTYSFQDQIVIANETDPKIPAYLGDTVKGVLGLDGFHKKNIHHTPVKKVEGINPEFRGPYSNLLGPGDFAVAYNLNPLYNSGFDGTGQTIAIVARSDFNLSDITTFRNTFNLPSKAPTKIYVSQNPGILSGNEETEVLLDTEWSGAVAKNATIKVVIGKSTQTADGVDASIQYIVNNNVAPVVSMSFGLCEASLGSSGNQFYNNLFAQGAAQGQSIFVSTGDSGAASCFDSQGRPIGPAGVNGLSSTPYNVAVGGTSLQNPVFDSTGALVSVGSEVVWNDGTNGGATGGGVSSIYAKPSWQVAPGVPADGKRDLPDISLMGSPGNIGYYLYQADAGGVFGIGGTSASAPAMAGIMSLVIQKNGVQGNPNPTFYNLGSAQYNNSGTAIFRDVTSGNNTFSGVTGYSAGAGYDAATGLGVPDANALVNNWGNTTPAQPPSVSLSVSPSSQTVTVGTSTTYVTTLNRTNFSGSVSLQVKCTTALPTGLTATLSSSATTANVVTVKITTTSNTPAGTYNFYLTGAATGLTIANSNTFSITTKTTSSPKVNLSASPSTQTIAPGQATSYTVSLSRTNFTGPVSLQAYCSSKIPQGITYSFATNPTSANTVTLTVSTSSSTSIGAYTFYIVGTATNTAVNNSNMFTLNVVNPSVNLSVSPTSRSINHGTSTTYTIALARTAFPGAVSLQAYYTGNVPQGVTYSLSANPTTTNSVTMTVFTSSTTAAKTYSFYIMGTASGATVNKSNTFTLTVR
jgi:subtilase family serine protease